MPWSSVVSNYFSSVLGWGASAWEFNSQSYQLPSWAFAGLELRFPSRRYQSRNGENSHWHHLQATCHPGHWSRFRFLHLWSIERTAKISGCPHHYRYNLRSKNQNLLKRTKNGTNSNETNQMHRFPHFVHSFPTNAPENLLFADEQPAELQDGLTSGGSKGQHGLTWQAGLVSLLVTFAATFNVLKYNVVTSQTPFPRWWQTLP